MASTSLDYKTAGVDITKGNELVNDITPLAQKTHGPEVLSPLGGFAGCYQLPSGYHEPVLVSGTDGVGTKLKIAQSLNKHHTIGIDLVAMCVNDIIVSGAKPLFFLDYYACNSLDKQIAYDVISGVSHACEVTGMSLLGGETAEMPGLYQNKDYDLAGFCVGVAEKSKLVNTNNIQEDDCIIALSSSGLHSNGFSLVRKIIEYNNLSLNQAFGTTTLGEQLLVPTVLYPQPLYELINTQLVQACAHITGGGLAENTARVIPDHLSAEFFLQDYQLPEIFQFLQHQGNIATSELWRTFNCGIGMIVITRPTDGEKVINYYKNYKFNSLNNTKAFQIGRINKKSQDQQQKVILNF